MFHILQGFARLSQSRWPLFYDWLTGSSAVKSDKVLLRQYRQNPYWSNGHDRLFKRKQTDKAKTNNLGANYIKSQGKVKARETGIKSLWEGEEKKKKLLSNFCSRRARLLIIRAAARPDKSYIIDMIFRLSGRVYVITSDMLNPSQIRFPNQPTSRLTTAFRGRNESATPPQTELTWTGVTSLRSDRVPAGPSLPLSLSPSLYLPSTDLRPFINTAVIYPLSHHKQRVTTYITAFSHWVQQG